MSLSFVACRRVAVSICASVSLLATLPAPGTAAVPAGDGRIGFERLAGGLPGDLIEVDQGGANATVLAGKNSPLAESALAYSWDGEAFVHASEVDHQMGIRIRRNGASSVITTGRDPSFFPGDDRIAYASAEDGDWEIYAIDVDGTDRERLTDNTIPDRHPSVGPDGEVYFDREYAKTTQIMKIAPNGDLEQLTTSYANESSRDPDVSRDGTRVLFEREVPNWRRDVFTMTSSGTGEKPVTQAFPRRYAHRDPAWSPSGNRFVWAVEVGLDGGGGLDWNLYTASADGASPKALTSGPEIDGSPDWRPRPAGVGSQIGGLASRARQPAAE